MYVNSLFLTHFGARVSRTSAPWAVRCRLRYLGVNVTREATTSTVCFLLILFVQSGVKIKLQSYLKGDSDVQRKIFIDWNKLTINTVTAASPASDGAVDLVFLWEQLVYSLTETVCVITSLINCRFTPTFLFHSLKEFEGFELNCDFYSLVWCLLNLVHFSLPPCFFPWFVLFLDVFLLVVNVF